MRQAYGIRLELEADTLPDEDTLFEILTEGVDALEKATEAKAIYLTAHTIPGIEAE